VRAVVYCETQPSTRFPQAARVFARSLATARTSTNTHSTMATSAMRHRLYLLLQGYDTRVVGYSQKVAETASMVASLQVAGPIPLPTLMHRWTVNKSPFVHKKARETFERRTHRRLLVLQGPPKARPHAAP